MDDAEVDRQARANIERRRQRNGGTLPPPAPEEGMSLYEFEQKYPRMRAAAPQGVTVFRGDRREDVGSERETRYARGGRVMNFKSSRKAGC